MELVDSLKRFLERDGTVRSMEVEYVYTIRLQLLQRDIEPLLDNLWLIMPRLQGIHLGS